MTARPDNPDTVQASLGEDLLLPGGKVDPDAIRRAVERARERAAAAADAESDEDERLPRVTFTLQRDLHARLDVYLTSRITFMSRTRLQRLIESGGVTVNDRPAKPSTRLGLGDRVEVVVPPPQEKGLQPEEMPLDVLYEDARLIVLNKAPDVIVHPARSELSGTLINGLAWRFRNVSGGSLSAVGEEFARPGVVHRLDRHTSGCIVFAKDDEAHWRLGRQFERRTVDKRYLAVVQGRVEPVTDVIDLPIGPHPSREKGYREKQVVRHDDLGRPSVTICRVHERYELPESWPRHAVAPSLRRFSLVELELKTGRTHQIRVHLSHLGWPIVGDDMYGGRPFTDETGRTVIARQALHAGLLAFEHPASGEPMVFTAPVPPDMADLVSCLRRGRVERSSVPGTVPVARFGLE
ncbi:MAG: RluA family pseudouridine synthase [Leptolyngbya sp. PLA2]|nr:RluA family pseudouridine synthase [Leptolyngbya sp.]MCE7972527.1 RluA family pseudouridine synthase [Leptolyngbya sp. PL-A2]MCZ7632565.1 RluA family pseudouridine synthase [Phycisphaerales bacterium]MDL1904977.1 RluA family pseudouridine synthase [Synechococcales cyanobacterium CNB]GIK19877.1 MAG: pseudouridine synthase [Planctomycetota bacterium]